MSTKIKWDPATRKPWRGPRPVEFRRESRRVAQRLYRLYHAAGQDQARRSAALDARTMRRADRDRKRQKQRESILKAIPGLIVARAKAIAEERLTRAEAAKNIFLRS